MLDLEASADGNAIAVLLRGLDRALQQADRDQRLGALVANALGTIASLTVAHSGLAVRVAFEPRRGVADSGDLPTDLADALIAAATAASAAGKVIVVTVDEIQALPAVQMAALFGALQRLARHDLDPTLGTRLPVVAVVAGLPGSRAALRAGAGTYAERVREHPLDLLDDAAATEALRVPASERGVRWSADAITSAVDAAGGYPFAVQLLGYEIWSAAATDPSSDLITASDATRGVAAAKRELDRIYASRLDELPDTERHYLEAVAALPADQRRSATIAQSLGGSAHQWSWARARLIHRGLLRAAGHGRVTFALPGLDDHLTRNPPAPR